MDIENALVSKLITTGKLESAISRGVVAEHFADEEAREIFTYLLSYSRRYGTSPSTNAVKTEYEDYEVIQISDSLDFLLDQFTVSCKRRCGNELLEELMHLAADKDESKQIDMHLVEASRKIITLFPSTEVDDFLDMDQRVKQYEIDKLEGKPTGLPWGFPKLDRWTGGLQSHEFATVAGFSGLGKSTFLKKVGISVWEHDAVPLYVTLEEESKAILRKFDAMIANLDYRSIKNLNLPEEQLEHWSKIAAKIKKKGISLPVSANMRNCTPDMIYAETLRHKPDLVIIDYISLMRSNRANKGASLWQTVTEITQDLKQNARVLGIPILAAAQTNRSGGKDGAELDNIGNSISIVQDSDIVIGLFADETMRENKTMEIRLRKNRDGALGQFEAVWDHERMIFREKGPYEDRERNEENEEKDDQEKVDDLKAKFTKLKPPKLKKRPGQ